MDTLCLIFYLFIGEYSTKLGFLSFIFECLGLAEYCYIWFEQKKWAQYYVNIKNMHTFLTQLLTGFPRKM